MSPKSGKKSDRRNFADARSDRCRRDAIVQYLEEVVDTTMPILDNDRAAADWHARERARLTSRGDTPPFVDGQIAAIACVNDPTLVTFNDADFRQFQDLRVVRW